MKKLIWIAAVAIELIGSARADLTSAMSKLKDHITGTNTLGISAINTQGGEVLSNRWQVGNNFANITQALDLVNIYESTEGPLFQNSVGSNFSRTDTSSVDKALALAMLKVYQAIIEDVYTASNLANRRHLLEGFKFMSADYFPGAVTPPSDPDAVYSVQINASQPKAWGYPVDFQTLPARRPTGAYLAPGSIATVTVPQALVNQGFKVRVGAHVADLSAKSSVKRIDRVSRLFSITSTETLVANPLGGGIYIEVPYEKEKGLVTIEIKNTVRSPFYSNTSARQTTLAQWRSTERNHPGPWADFESDKFMMNVPTGWIYSYSNPVLRMGEWDDAMDAVSELQGLPLVRPKTVLYCQIDVSLDVAVYSPGYPQSNDWYSPNNSVNGNQNHDLLNGPKFCQHILFHELGHAIAINKFAGETESLVNLLYVAVHHRKFGVSLDESFGRSLNRQYGKAMTRKHAALNWVVTDKFRNGEAMNGNDMKYQHRGHGKYVDIAGLFGWEALGDFWHSVAVDYENGITYSKNSDPPDSRILRMSIAAGVDLTPLIYFWGRHPNNAANLKSSIAAAGLAPSAQIYDRLVYYQSVVPMNAAQFRTHDNAVHNLVSVQEQDWYTTMRTGWTQALGEASVARIQEIIDEYFPDGRPVVDLTPPSPNPMTWVMPPVAYDSNTIIMEAAVASDASAAVEYYFENTNNGDNSGWISGTSWSNTGLTVGQSYSYRVRARDSQGNTGNWSAVATAISAEDHTAPNPDPMTWETPPAELSSSAIMMTASTAVDPTGVQYYFTCTSGPGHDSGWQDSPVYMDAGLDAFATCSYTVMARDKSANANQTAASPSAAATITRAVPGVLFADTFNRANSTNLNASDSGKSGALGLLNYSTKTFDATTLDITNNRLRINGPANDGAYGGLVYIDDHNFVDASIALSGGFSVSVDIAAYITAGSGRQMSVGVGQSLADLNAQSGVGPGNHSSDLLVAYRNTTDDLEIYKNGVLDAEETVLSGLPNAPTTMRIDYTLTDFEEGSTVIYHVYFDDASSAFTSGTFTWSGTDENYISLASNLSEDSLFDNLEIRGEDTYEDLIPPTPNPMIWELVPTAVSPEAITMTATTATDFSGVEYYFKNTTVTDGSHDSGWQSASTYTDTGLAPETIYTYTVTARDNAPLGFNETESSDEESASTTALLIATMAPVGSGSGYDVSSAEARAFRSTGMAKTLDVDDDNVYGTAGTFFYGNGVDNTSNSDETPSWVTAVSSSGAAFVALEAYVDFDNPTLATSDSVADWDVTTIGLLNTTGTTGGLWAELITFTVDASAPRNFRLGVMAGNENTADGRWDPAGLRLSCEGGEITEVSGLPPTDLGMIFFDVTLLNRASGTFSIEGQNRSLGSKTRGPSIAGITFDESISVSDAAYEQWATSIFSGAPAGVDRTASGNPDGDRFDNWMEWSLVTNPLEADGPTMDISVSGDNFIVTYFRRDPALTGIDVYASWTRSLTDEIWRLNGDGMIESSLGWNDDVETVSASLPLDGETGFIRINALEN